MKQPLLIFYKALLTVLFVAVQVSTLFSQSNPVQVTVQVLPPYSTRISDYGDYPNKTIITLQNRGRLPLQVQLLGAITGDNGIEVRTKENYRSPQPISLNALEVKRLDGGTFRELFDANNIQVSGLTRSDLSRGTGLPEGNYSICVWAVDYTTRTPLSDSEPMGCSNNIRITNLEPPVVIKPSFWTKK